MNVHMSSSSARAGFREATGIRRAPTSQRRRRALFVDQVLAWSRLGLKRSFASLIGGAKSEDLENTVNYKEFGSNRAKTQGPLWRWIWVVKSRFNFG